MQYRVTSRWAVLVSLCAVVLGCAPATRYRVQRAALIPPPAPPMWSGKVRPTGLSVGDISVVWHRPPVRSDESDSGLYVTRTELDFVPHVEIVKDSLEIWLPMGYGLRAGAFSTHPGLIEAPDSGVFRIGLGLAGTIRFDDVGYLGIAGEWQNAFVPTNIHAVPVGSGYTIDRSDIDMLPILRLSFVGGADFGWARVFAGLSIRNHPTNTRLREEIIQTEEELDGDVGWGSPYVTLGVGAEFDVGDYVSLFAHVYQPLPMFYEDILYGPIVGLSVDVHLSRSKDQALASLRSSSRRVRRGRDDPAIGWDIP